MVNEKDIVFLTNSLNTKWIKYQSDIVKDLFPLSDHVIINGHSNEFRINWPSSWFYWIEHLKNRNEKYYIHVDEDFFITNKEELLKCIEKMEVDNIDMMGCSDGYHHFRQNNPVAINPFFMIGKIEHLKDLDFKNIKFHYDGKDWINNHGILFKEEFSNDLDYKHEKFADAKFNNFEPFYAFLWKLKEMGLKFDYLYPHFDDELKSTNPRLNKESNDIGIHMWYTRQWSSEMDVFGVKNIDRYNKLEKKILNNE
jgi:hypothetical protein